MRRIGRGVPCASSTTQAWDDWGRKARTAMAGRPSCRTTWGPSNPRGFPRRPSTNRPIVSNDVCVRTPHSFGRSRDCACGSWGRLGGKRDYGELFRRFSLYFRRKSADFARTIPLAATSAFQCPRSFFQLTQLVFTTDEPICAHDKARPSTRSRRLLRIRCQLFFQRELAAASGTSLSAESSAFAFQSASLPDSSRSLAGPLSADV